jgi:hypothetical protein
MEEGSVFNVSLGLGPVDLPQCGLFNPSTWPVTREVGSSSRGNSPNLSQLPSLVIVTIYLIFFFFFISFRVLLNTASTAIFAFATR